MTKTVIIDDDKDVVEFITTALERLMPSVKVIGKAYSGYDGITEIKRNRPDLVLLDVEMSDMNGFEMLDLIPERNFEVIFITAYDQYAVEAFKANAVGYILKPIDRAELQKTIEKAEEEIEKKNLKEKIKMRQKIIPVCVEKKIKITTHEGIEYLSPEDIIKIKAHAAYSEIHLINKEIITISKNLKETEKMIDDRTFFRIHKSYMINLNYVKGFVKINDGGMVKLKDGSRVEVSKRKIVEFKSIMDKLSNPKNFEN